MTQDDIDQLQRIIARELKVQPGAGITDEIQRRQAGAQGGAQGGLVIGSDQAAEAVMGFYTKHGDGACDVVPLTGLTKGQVRDMAAQLGAPDTLVNKVPTADLESLRPQLSDEEALGVSYAAIDRFLTGESVAPEDAERIIATWRRTAHKRAMPRTP